ncbi:hypothetical protein EDB92DRAFT_906280 [Lactarius akahatsu]|uniref:Uncharacterized protein n=1 Tax=Lactarius akahatsu TaxID=416441 RepID=A0AAD4LCY4_9AGAM|nr:hypothetical protein EDB92DRAFT_906280 [Lactarius akahatsu]
MPKLEESLIDNLTPRPEVREKARALLRTVHSKTGPGTGYDIGEAKIGLPAICAYIASKSAGYADVTEDVAQKASCLAPRQFASTLRTVKAALHVPKTPAGSPSKSKTDVDPIAYATLIKEHKIGRPLRVESWMKEAQAALVALPRYKQKFASHFADSGIDVRIAVFFWVCRTIKISHITYAPLVDKYGVTLRVFSRLVKMLEEECVDVKESIKGTIRELTKKTGGDAPSKTPATPSQSRPASPTKSALRTASSLTSSLTGSVKRKVAFSLSDISASEDDVPPETPSKRPRTTPRTRTLPVRKTASTSSSEEASEDIEMSDAPPPPLVASEPVAGPSTPRRPKATATPTHAYRTPPSARMQALAIFSDDEDGEAEEEMAVVDAHADVGQVDDALPLSRRFRPVFLDRVQWAQRAPRLARERVAAEKRTRELMERWGHPLEALQLAIAEAAAG